MSEKIMSVESVSASIGKSNPPTLSVEAKGTVNSGGWTNPSLSLYVYVTPPADGIQEFDFLADKPTGMATQELEPIEASYSDICAEWVRGVRIHSASNSVEDSW